MRIVADENIPLLKPIFGDLGEIIAVPGRTMTREHLMGADLLLVRSVTPVNEGLLSGSSVKFVGTCTIGTDHLDTGYLEAQGIGYASAPGCNANGVVDYVLSVFAELRPNWLNLTVGVIGCGNVGGRLLKTLERLGVSCRGYDPFLCDESSELPLSSLGSVLDSDIVCCHAPLTKTGAYPTYHLVGDAELKRLRKGALLVSAGRGPVVDNLALKRLLKSGADLSVALDVWEPEPEIDKDLMGLIDIATPHIAGYSYDGRVMGTAMIYSAVMSFLERDCITPEALVRQYLPSVALEQLPSGGKQSLLNALIKSVYRACEDDDRFRKTLKLLQAGSEIGAAFDDLRKSYPMRRELASLGDSQNGLLGLELLVQAANLTDR